MRATILTPSGAAYQVHNECLQARINPTWANDDDCGELGKGSQEFGVAGHDQHTVWHESHNGLSDLRIPCRTLSRFHDCQEQSSCSRSPRLSCFLWQTTKLLMASPLCPCVGYCQEGGEDRAAQPLIPTSAARKWADSKSLRRKPDSAIRPESLRSLPTRAWRGCRPPPWRQV